jgi:hypothetical protein
MEKYFSSYVDSDFLKGFLSQKNKFNVEDSSDSLEVWRSLLKFYREKAKLIINLNEVKVNDLVYGFESALMRELLIVRASQSSPDVLVYANNSDFKLSDIQPIYQYDFLFGDNAKSYQIESYSNGVPYLSSEDFKSVWAMYSKTGMGTIPARDSMHNGKTGWGNLGLPKHNFNSLIICDNYLFDNEVNITNNFIPILDCLFPDNILEIEFDLTIFSSSFYNLKDKNQVTKSDISQIYQEILKALQIYLNLTNVNLSIIYKKLNAYHDRHIFTNGFIFKSGNSFKYFGENNKPILPSETTLDIHPMAADNGNNTYAELYQPFMNRLKRIVDESKIHAGSKRNRLFDKFCLKKP